MKDIDWQQDILSVYRRERPRRVVWQPRIDFWFLVNKARGTLPDRYKNATLLDVHDDLETSIRYFIWPLKISYEKTVLREQRNGDRLIRTWITPIGELREVLHFTDFGYSHYHEEYRVKTADDLRILEYILQDSQYEFDTEGYQSDVERVGRRGVPQFFYRRSPLQSLIIEYMGFERTVYALQDAPEAINHFIEVASKADDRMYQVLLSCPVPILNLGENIDACLNPPPMFLKFHIPYYRKRVTQIKAAGKFCHIHMDGSLKPLLPYLRSVDWDGIEAATPFPQGDVTLCELKEAMGDLILLDGIPALYFLPHYSESDLVKCVEELVRLFYPSLILGISDELPPDGDIERVRLVSRLIRDLV
ncbi:MAG: hypothetical protein NZ959_11995 [Armatimonadetes bacterium]|nr:hypothetical protein [Armatimonadota bacterium]MDW8122583.1 hypothetical protein [Armatimonadota bacterium]